MKAVDYSYKTEIILNTNIKNKNDAQDLVDENSLSIEELEEYVKSKLSLPKEC